VLVVRIKSIAVGAIAAILTIGAIAVGLVVTRNSPTSTKAEVTVISTDLHTTWCASYNAVASVNGPTQMRRAMKVAVAGLRVPLAELKVTSWPLDVSRDAHALADEVVGFRSAALTLATNPNPNSIRAGQKAFTRLRSDVDRVRSDVGLSRYSAVRWIVTCPH
jgi:hypothetical protein